MAKNIHPVKSISFGPSQSNIYQMWAMYYLHKQCTVYCKERIRGQHG